MLIYIYGVYFSSIVKWRFESRNRPWNQNSALQ